MRCAPNSRRWHLLPWGDSTFLFDPISQKQGQPTLLTAVHRCLATLRIGSGACTPCCRDIPLLCCSASFLTRAIPALQGRAVRQGFHAPPGGGGHAAVCTSRRL